MPLDQTGGKLDEVLRAAGAPAGRGSATMGAAESTMSQHGKPPQPLKFPPLPPPLEPTPEFVQAAAEDGVEFEPGDLERLGRFLALLLEVNRQFNLTAVTEPAEVWMRHALDSLTLLGPLAMMAADEEQTPEGETSTGGGGPRDGPLRVIDVGSGGGLPGLVLAIVLPDVQFTLLESTGKKAEFLMHAAKALGLPNVQILNERAEKAGHDPSHRERYDAAMARAVGPLAVIAELTVPLVRVGGQVLLIKGARAAEELLEARQALYMLHVQHAGTIETRTNRLVVLEKMRKTPRVYPRREGEPKRAPLGRGR
jgi:16S rRNA (guanine527-N7)-methyltransferase